MMKDRDVIDAFVRGGARKAFGPALHIEGDALYIDGWWQAAFRVAPAVFILRNEEAPEGSTGHGDVAAALGACGLAEVGVDLVAMTAIVYAEVSLGGVSWALWASDLAAGEAALAARVTTESFFGDSLPGAAGAGDEADLPDFGAEIGGARRIAGLPASLVLTVGLPVEVVDQLRGNMAECRVVSRTFEDLLPTGCGGLLPSMIVVDAGDHRGPEFIAALRSDVFCRFLPVAAVTAGGVPPPGADLALGPGQPAAWADPLRRILP